MILVGQVTTKPVTDTPQLTTTAEDGLKSNVTRVDDSLTKLVAQDAL